MIFSIHNIKSDKRIHQYGYFNVLFFSAMLLLCACEEKLPPYTWEKLADFQVYQNNAEAVPKLLGDVKVHVANIRSGTRAHIQIMTREGETLASRRSVRVGEGVRFKFKQNTYMVKVEQYIARPFRDYAMLSISLGTPKEVLSGQNINK